MPTQRDTGEASVRKHDPAGLERSTERLERRSSRLGLPGLKRENRCSVHFRASCQLVHVPAEERPSRATLIGVHNPDDITRKFALGGAQARALARL